MNLYLSGKRALITGGSKGIGRAAAEILAEEGCDLVLVARDPAALAATADAIRGAHQVNVETRAADLSRQAEVERIAQSAGPIDILVNNAGAIPPGTLLTVDDATLRTAWDLKVFGFISLARALYPALRDRKGVIVNVIGAAGETFDPGYIAGVAGNAALMAFTRGLGRGAPKDGMRVVGINPGPVATQRMERLLRHPRRDRTRRSHPLARTLPDHALRPPRRARRDRCRNRLPRQPPLRLHQRHHPHHQRRPIVSQ